jgi:hypothetical protein
MILLAITLLAFLSAAPARALRYELRESAGLLFRNEDRSLRKIVGHENAEFAVKIPAFHELSSLVNHTTDAHYCHTFRSFERECRYVHTSLRLENSHVSRLIAAYNREVAFLVDDLAMLHIKPNSKRALLDISYLLSSLFGVASSHDIRKMEQYIRTTLLNSHKNQKDITSVFDYLSKFRNATSSNFKNLRAHINNTNAALSVTLTRLDTITERVTAIFGHFDNIQDDLNVIRALDQVVMTAHRQSQQSALIADALHDIRVFRAQINLLHAGKLPSDLVTPDILKRVISSLRPRLVKRNLQALPVEPNWNYYYDTAHAIAYKFGDTVLVSIKVPLLRANHVFDMYKILAYPVPFHSTSFASINRSSTLHTTDDYMVITRDRDQYGFLNSHEYQLCRENDFVCPYPHIMYNKKADHCLYQLLVNNRITPACSFTHSVSPPDSDVIQVDDSAFLLVNVPSPIRVECVDKPDTFRAINKHAILHLPCDCGLSTDLFTMRSHYADCSQDQSTIDISYPLNVVQLQHLDDKVIANVTNARTVVKTPPRLQDIISLESISPSTDEHQIPLLPQQASFYDYETNNLGSFTPRFDSGLTELVMAFVIFIWNTALTIGLIFIFIRFRAALIMGLMASNTTTTTAYVIRTDPMRPSVNPVVSGIADIDSTLIAIGVTISLSVALVGCIRLTTYVLAKCRPHRGQQAILYLKIFNANDVCLIRLKDIPLDKDLVYNQVPTMISYDVSYSTFFPRVTFSWDGTLAFAFKSHSNAITVPDLLSISYKNAMTLHSIKASRLTMFYSFVIQPNGSRFITPLLEDIRMGSRLVRREANISGEPPASV